MTTPIPALLAGLVDDAAVFPPGSASLADAVAGHRVHRASWYRAMVGPLLVPASGFDQAATLLRPGELLRVGLIADTGLDQLESLLGSAGRPAPGGADPGTDPAAGMRITQVEAPVAKRGEDPQPGLARLIDLVAAAAVDGGGTTTGTRGVRAAMAYAEVPLTWGLLGALDALAAARGRGVPVAAKFRTGGLAAELFPSPGDLAAVICACRDRGLPFKLTAGLHRAARHADTETGFVHHGFLNVLTAAILADRGGTVDQVADVLAGNDPAPLADAVRQHLDDDRPLWIGFGSCSIAEPLTDLVRLGLINDTTGARDAETA